jgi:hypothetical protein
MSDDESSHPDPIGYPGMNPLPPPAASGLLPPSSSLSISEIWDMSDPCRDEKLSCPLSLLPAGESAAAALLPLLKPMPALSMLVYPGLNRVGQDELSSRNRMVSKTNSARTAIIACAASEHSMAGSGNCWDYQNKAELRKDQPLSMLK